MNRSAQPRPDPPSSAHSASTVTGPVSLLIVSASFLALTVSAGAATYGLLKRRYWNWPAQAVLAVLLPVLYLIVYANLQSA